METSALQPFDSLDSPARDFVPVIGLQTANSHMLPGWFLPVEVVSRLLRYTCATGDLGERCIPGPNASASTSLKHMIAIQVHGSAAESPETTGAFLIALGVRPWETQTMYQPLWPMRI